MSDDDALASMQQRIETAIEDRRRTATNAFLADEATLKARYDELHSLIYQDDSFAAHREYLKLEAEVKVVTAALDALKIAMNAAFKESTAALKAHRLETRPLAIERISIMRQLDTLRADRKRKLEVMEAAELK